jgi:predicted negative regulator of RcsB-dependent stress response
MDRTPLEVFVAARITRKELKADKFAVEVEHTVDYVAHHRAQVVRYGIAAVVIVALAIGIYFYRQHEHGIRQDSLAQAIQLQEAYVGPTPPAGTPVSFPTEEAKVTAVTKAFTDLATKHSGSNEGLIAEYYLGSSAADQNKTAEAEKHFKKVIDDGDNLYRSLAQLSLAQIYMVTGRAAEAEKLLRTLMDHPTLFVSKEEAAISLARAIGKTKPDEARKLLEPLRTSRSSVSQLAVGALGELSQR